jgi:hypothetical protein
MVSPPKETYLVNPRKFLDIRSMKNPQRQTNHLQILAARCRRNISWLCSDIINDCPLKPWDKEMGSLFDDVFFDS